MSSPSLSTILRDHVSLSITSLDPLYLGGYLPTLQTSGQLVTFCQQRLHAPIASPALFGPLTDRFIKAVHQFAAQQSVPVIHFTRGQRKDDVVARYRARFTADEGVVVIGIAQEKMNAFAARKVVSQTGSVTLDFSRRSVAVNHVYFYVHDPEWGPALIKIGTYLCPFQFGCALTATSGPSGNWISTASPSAHSITASAGVPTPNGSSRCAMRSPTDVQAFFDRWLDRLPWPLSAADRAGGYRHRLSLWQVEVSLTQVFDVPSWGRRLFERIIRDNLDLGRPDRVSLLFPTRLARATPPPPFGYRTRVITRGVQPSLHVDFKRSHVKQYFKEGGALRTEPRSTIRPTSSRRKLWPRCRTYARSAKQINARLLDMERLAHEAMPQPSLVDQLQRPRCIHGQRIAALRVSDPRVLALLQALCQVAPRPGGFRHRDVRPIVAGLLGRDLAQYSAGAMTYDLRRLRLHGLIQRVPHTFRYTVTDDGLHLAFGISRTVLRLLQPGWDELLRSDLDLPPPLRDALLRLDAALRSFAATTRPLTKAA